MKKTRFTDEKIFDTLKLHAAGGKAGERCRQHAISDPTNYRTTQNPGDNFHDYCPRLRLHVKLTMISHMNPLDSQNPGIPEALESTSRSNPYFSATFAASAAQNPSRSNHSACPLFIRTHASRANCAY
jgi:hypothetical protein